MNDELGVVGCLRAGGPSPGQALHTKAHPSELVRGFVPYFKRAFPGDAMADGVDDVWTRIQAAMRGVENGWGERETVGHGSGESRIKNPDPELLYLLVTRVMNWDYYTPFEKVRWRAFIKFEGSVYGIAQSKMSGLSMWGGTSSEDDARRFNELMKKLRSACKLVAKWVEAYGKEAVRENNFFLQNGYMRVWHLHRHHMELFEAALAVLNGEEERTTMGPSDQGTGANPTDAHKSTKNSIAALLQGERDRWRATLDIDRFGSAAIVFFFAALESFLESYVAFADPRPCELQDLRKMRHFKDRFKKVLPVDSDKNLERIYRELLWLKRSVRDIVVHGYVGDESTLVPVAGKLLVPMIHRPWEEDIRRYWIPLEVGLARRAQNAIRDMDNWIDGDDLSWVVRRYLETGAAIPFLAERLDQLRPHMSSRDKWEKEIRRITNFEDDMRNFDF